MDLWRVCSPAAAGIGSSSLQGEAQTGDEWMWRKHYTMSMTGNESLVQLTMSELVGASLYSSPTEESIENIFTRVINKRKTPPLVFSHAVSPSVFCEIRLCWSNAVEVGVSWRMEVGDGAAAKAEEASSSSSAGCPIHLQPIRQTVGGVWVSENQV